MHQRICHLLIEVLRFVTFVDLFLRGNVTNVMVQDPSKFWQRQIGRKVGAVIVAGKVLISHCEEDLLKLTLVINIIMII